MSSNDLQRPSVGRIVHYVQSLTERHIAGIVTDASDDDTFVTLAIFPPSSTPESRRSVPFDPEAGWATWHWPERVDPFPGPKF